MKPLHRALLLAAGMSIAACNLVTGAEGLDVETDEDVDDGGGAAGAGAGPSSGAGLSDGSGASSSTGAASGGAGGASSASTSASTGASTSASTGATTSGSGVSTAASSGSGGSNCGGAGPGTTPLDAEEQAFLVLINNYRQQNGLGTLTACTSLNRTAQGHSEDMRDNNYFSHTGLNNSTPWVRACNACYDLGCGPQTAMAENIAAGNSGAQATFTQWQNSPGHDANMLGPNFTQIGIGRATGGGMYGVYWTNVFGGDSEPSCN